MAISSKIFEHLGSYVSPKYSLSNEVKYEKWLLVSPKCGFQFHETGPTKMSQIQRR